jgi:hypothetical protein
MKKHLGNKKRAWVLKFVFFEVSNLIPPGVNFRGLVHTKFKKKTLALNRSPRSGW